MLSVSLTQKVSPFQDINIIGDGVKDVYGSQDSSKQYDTYIGGGGNPNEFIGYTFDTAVVAKGISLQEGKHFWDGGWWETGPDVEVQVGGTWVPATGVAVTPRLPSEGITGAWAGTAAQVTSYEEFEFTFDPVETTGVRLIGNTGGQDHFISIGEMRINGLEGSNCAGGGGGAPRPP